MAAPMQPNDPNWYSYYDPYSHQPQHARRTSGSNPTLSYRPTTTYLPSRMTRTDIPLEGTAPIRTTGREPAANRLLRMPLTADTQPLNTTKIGGPLMTASLEFRKRRSNQLARNA